MLIVAVLLPVGDRVARAGGSRVALADLRQAAQDLQGWQVEDAAALIARLRALAPADPAVELLAGELAFYQGDYRDAVVQLDASAKGGVEEAKQLESAAASAAGVTDGYVEDDSPGGHFAIWHARGRDDLLVPYAGMALEAQYAALSADLGYAPPGKVRVEIYDSPDDLAQTTMLSRSDIETSGTIAVCKWNRVMVTSPAALVRGYPWMDTLAHEYTHFVITHVSANTVPIWMQEGVAKFEEQRWRQATGTPMSPESESLLAGAIATGGFVTFAEMHPSIAKLPSQDAAALAFAEVRSVIDLIVSRKGYGALRAIFVDMRKGMPEDAALVDVLGENEDALWRDWRDWIAAKGLRRHPGLELSKLQLAPSPGSGGGTRDDDQDRIDQIAVKRAREAARLGGLLRVHQRLAAAAVEYQKAAAILGPSNELIESRLARTYLELGQPAKAIAAAKPTAAMYPDVAGPHATLGEAYLLLGDEADAEPELWAALRVSPFDPSLHCGLARIYQDRGDASSAARESGFCSELGGAVPPPTPAPSSVTPSSNSAR